MRAEISVSFQINRNFFCETSFSPEISITSTTKKPCVSLSVASHVHALCSASLPHRENCSASNSVPTRCSVGKKGKKKKKEREREMKKREILLNRAKRKRLAEEIGQAHEVSVKRSLRAVREGTTIKAQARSKLSAGNYLRLPDRAPTHAFSRAPRGR